MTNQEQFNWLPILEELDNHFSEDTTEVIADIIMRTCVPRESYDELKEKALKYDELCK